MAKKSEPRLKLTGVGFKSDPGIYEIEESGVKPNTVRVIDQKDPRFVILRRWCDDDKYGTITITNSADRTKFFERQITNLCYYMDGLVVISWAHKEKLSARPQELVQQTDNKPTVVDYADNIMIWIDGNTPGWGRDCLKGYIEGSNRDYDERMASLRSQINSFTKKVRRNKEYWYQWTKGAWKYIGPVDAKHDPRDGLRKDLENMAEAKVKALQRIKSCVIKELPGKHLVVDIDLFKTHVDKRFPENIIKLEDVIS